MLKRKVQLVTRSATLILLTEVAAPYHRSVIYFIRKNRNGITATPLPVTAAKLIRLLPKVNRCQG